ncbi:MAG: CoA transferase, partial [Alphaproteobacteria bacterium]
MRVLDGIRVLDFGRYIAGPFCSALLGDMGADVIRIERPGGGEDRVVGPVTEDGIGAGFFQLNRNKRSLTLNPTSKEGREIVKKLVATADVV